MQVCVPGDGIAIALLHGGISRCGFELYCGVISIFCCILLVTIRGIRHAKYAPARARHSQKSIIAKLWTICAVLALIVPCVDIAAAATVTYDLTGSELVWSSAVIVLWLTVLAFDSYDKNYKFNGALDAGWNGFSGYTFILVWMELVMLSVEFGGVNSDLWFFNGNAVARLAFFCFEYGLTATLALSMVLPVYRWETKRRDYEALDGKNVPKKPLKRSKSLMEGSTFDNFTYKVKALIPFVWPSGERRLQIYVGICFAILVVGRVVNVYVPLYSKYITNSLTYTNATTTLVFQWDLILTYILLRFFQGGAGARGGFLNNARSFLWIRIQQFTSRKVKVDLLAHLHSLSLRWHLGRRTGEVLKVMDRGTESINQMLSFVLFQILPTIVDIAIAIIYFTTAFNAWFGLIVFATMGIYLATTVYISDWRTKYRRMENVAQNVAQAKAVDSLLNFETVKYYNAEEFEVSRYKTSVLEYQDAEFKSNATMVLLNTCQNVIINIGLMAGSLLCAWMVVGGINMFNVGDYVLYTTYIMQLYQPLNILGMLYRQIQQAFIDMENMLQLLEQDQEIKDDPNASAIVVGSGRIEFKDVNFSYYHERPILEDVSFVAEPGQSVALVGPSGGGKSTVIRLLFRFYDVTSGTISVDGQDISKVTQTSLRSAIGVVPQDTVLFNDSIRYNIGYGRPAAGNMEIESAAKSAEIHDKILTFPEGYSTVVGERGLKLSGGEKQRVAIARTILKSPSLVLLDEATSALDTQTERSIQTALSEVCSDRTTIVVAHRLSTITKSDLILVLAEGRIVERGTHDQLVSKGGYYADLWQQQLHNPDAVEVATKDPNDGGGGSAADEDGEAELPMPKLPKNKSDMFVENEI